MSEFDFYRQLVRPILFALDPETAHHLALRALRCASETKMLLRALERFAPPSKPVSVFGLNFPNPLGLAAGFDKNGVALPAWAALGFGFVEIGTVTAQAQPGNPRPRIFRYPAQRALINRLGFNNDGADAIARRLTRLRARGAWPRIPIGINLGKSKVTPLETAPEDYRYSFRRLREFADYIVLNVSSPNTPGLRDLQAEEALGELLKAIRKENESSGKPVLLKIAPDLSLGDLERIISLCEANEIAGLVATNTTLDHSSIRSSDEQIGGLSGAPLRQRSSEFVRAIRARTTLPIMAVGGVEDAESAREKFEAGASLVQIYTGYIYRGPPLIREIVESLI